MDEMPADERILELMEKFDKYLEETDCLPREAVATCGSYLIQVFKLCRNPIKAAEDFCAGLMIGVTRGDP